MKKTPQDRLCEDAEWKFWCLMSNSEYDIYLTIDLKTINWYLFGHTIFNSHDFLEWVKSEWDKNHYRGERGEAEEKWRKMIFETYGNPY